jgi:hypothetical protein
VDSQLFPHLWPDLRHLSGDALCLWGDENERRQALSDVLAAWQGTRSAALLRAAHRIDAAVVAGLAALGLPRAAAVPIEVDAFGRRWMGRFTPEGVIRIDAEQIARHLAAGGHPDRVFHTWVHESLHARQWPGPGRGAEYVNWPGFEEGLAEGLARVATVAAARMTVEEPSYEFPVQAYVSLAESCGTTPDRVWRALWHLRPGDVRDRFAATIDGLLSGLGSVSPGNVHHSRLMSVADRVFAADRLRDTPNPAALRRLWQTVFS